MTKYILIVFAESVNQDDFVGSMREDINKWIGSNNTKIYYGDQSAIFTFDTTHSGSDLKDLILLKLGVSSIPFFLFPHDPNQIYHWLPEKIDKYLLSTDKMSDLPDTKRDFDIFTDDLVRNLSFENLKKDILKNLEESKNIDEEECEDIFTLQNKRKKEKSLDELLDKINDTGISSLTPQELKTLNNYSK